MTTTLVTNPSGASDKGWFTAGFASTYTPMWIGKISISGNPERAWSQFNGITIPQNSTINSAKVRIALGAGNTTGTRVYPKCKMVNQKTMPAKNGPALNSFFTGKVLPTPASVAMSYVNGSVTTGRSYWSTFQGNTTVLPRKWVFNVQTYTQSLVNSFSYSNDSMLVFFSSPGLEAAGTSIAYFQVGINKTAPVWPQLEISYTPPAVAGTVPKASIDANGNVLIDQNNNINYKFV